MAKQKDVSALFSRAFAKYDSSAGLIQRDLESGYLKSQPVTPTVSNVIDAPSYEMYPEKRAFEKAQQQQEEQKELHRFLSSLTDAEIENIAHLFKDRAIVSKSFLEELGSRGESLETERLEQHGIIRRNYLPDEKLFEFSLTAFGRRVASQINK
jgi:hypothetical protein